MPPRSSNGVTRIGTTPSRRFIACPQSTWNISSTGSVTGEKSGLVSIKGANDSHQRQITGSVGGPSGRGVSARDRRKARSGRSRSCRHTVAPHHLQHLRPDRIEPRLCAASFPAMSFITRATRIATPPPGRPPRPRRHGRAGGSRIPPPRSASPRHPPLSSSPSPPKHRCHPRPKPPTVRPAAPPSFSSLLFSSFSKKPGEQCLGCGGGERPAGARAHARAKQETRAHLRAPCAAKGPPHPQASTVSAGTPSQRAAAGLRSKSGAMRR